MSSKNYAITIGINKYTNLASLRYAQRDSELIRDFFLQEVGFDKVFHFSAESPNIIPGTGSEIPTLPTYANLRRFLRAQFERPILTVGDNFWFFFAGHGRRVSGCDYLLPCDVDPGDLAATALPLTFISERLRRCGADNVILILDACRNEDSRSGIGIGSDLHTGIITLASCSPNEISYEIESLENGSFTHALLEALRLKGGENCATVERLYHYVFHRVPLINQQHGKPKQTPYLMVDPSSKLNIVLLNNRATLRDAVNLKMEAYQAEVENRVEDAEKFWIRVLAISPADQDAINALRRIYRQPNEFTRELQAPNTDIKYHQSSLERLEITELQNYTYNSPGRKEDSLSGDRKESGEDKLSKLGGSIDFSHLQLLLETSEWKLADIETSHIILASVNRDKESWLKLKDVSKISCANLQTIDQLWKKYSNKKFGLNIQSQIYNSVGKEYVEFGERVGWRKHDQWKKFDEMNFSIEAPTAHLPVLSCMDGYVWENAFIQKVINCKLS